MGEKEIKKFKVIEHFVNTELGYPIECGIYEVTTKREHYFVVQTANEYRAISHSTDKTNLLQIKEERIKEIEELLKE